MLAAGLEPLEPYPGGGAPWRCLCRACGHEVSPAFGNVKKGTGCRVCAEASRSTRLRMDEALAIDRMRSAGLDPLEPYPGSQMPWRCQCLSCGRFVTPILVNVPRQRGCKYCARKATAAARRGARAVAETTAGGLR